MLALAALLASGLQPGDLVIAGGAVEPSNAGIYEAFLNARPDGRPGIVIIAGASGVPQQSFDAARDTLVRHGAKDADIRLLPLALLDDPATADVDESTWSDGGQDEALVELVGSAGAVWFTGGDQARLEILLPEDSIVLAALRRAHAFGSVVGGTSAGAAIMGNRMIARGDTITALLPDAGGEALRVDRGLGFSGIPLVDQHFEERARLGRLVAALCTLAPMDRLGVGVDENTALHVSGPVARIVGAGGVTLVDGRDAQCGDAIENMRVSVGGAGDAINLVTFSIGPAPWREVVGGNEAYDNEVFVGGGMAFPRRQLGDLLGRELLDNRGADILERISVSGDHQLHYRFGQDDQSLGWWGRDPSGRAGYTVSGVRFDISRP